MLDRCQASAVLEPFAMLDPTTLAALPASSPLTILSAALFAQLFYLGIGGDKLLLCSLEPPSAEFILLFIGPTRPVSAILPLPHVAHVLVLANGILLLANPLLSRLVRHLGSLSNVADFVVHGGEHDFILDLASYSLLIAYAAPS